MVHACPSLCMRRCNRTWFLLVFWGGGGGVVTSFLLRPLRRIGLSNTFGVVFHSLSLCFLNASFAEVRCFFWQKKTRVIVYVCCLRNLGFLQHVQVVLLLGPSARPQQQNDLNILQNPNVSQQKNIHNHPCFLPQEAFHLGETRTFNNIGYSAEGPNNKTT